MFYGQVGPELDDFFMRSAEREVQKAHGIEQGLRCMPERFEDDLLRHLGSPSSIRVAAHAVDDDEQGRMLRDRTGDSVLVLFAPAKEADIGVIHAQEEFRTSVRLGSALYHPAAYSRSFRSRLDNHSQHDRVRTPRDIGAVGYSRL
jgi:hypothetical protein